MNPSSPKKTIPTIDVDDNDDAFSDRPRNLRRRKKRRFLSSTAKYRLRLIGMGLGGVAFAVVSFFFMQKVVHPYKLGNEVSQQVAVVREQYDHQKKENAALNERLAFLRSKEGAEVEARRAGFHYKGETVFLLPNTAPASENPSATAQ